MSEAKSQLEQKILQKAKAAAAEILKREQDQTKLSLDKVRAESEVVLAEAVEQAKNRADMIRKEYEASAHLEAKLLLLQKKDQIAGRVIEQAWEQLKVRLMREDYRDVVRTLIAEAVASLGLSEAVVTLGKNEKQVVGSGFAEIERVVGSKLGKTIKLKLASDTLNAMGGVRVADAEGHLLYDNAWDARLERMKTDLVLEISEILFSGHAATQRPVVAPK